MNLDSSGCCSCSRKVSHDLRIPHDPIVRLAAPHTTSILQRAFTGSDTYTRRMTVAHSPCTHRIDPSDAQGRGGAAWRGSTPSFPPFVHTQRLEHRFTMSIVVANVASTRPRCHCRHLASSDKPQQTGIAVTKQSHTRTAPGLDALLACTRQCYKCHPFLICGQRWFGRAV